MKKNYSLFKRLIAILFVISGVCALRLNAQEPVSQKYDPEDDLIEVMFIESSQVRMRDGQLTDLISDALAGVGNYLQSFQWHQWTRISHVEEALIDQWARDGERNTGIKLYNLNNIYRLRIPKGYDVWEVAASLEAMPGIYLARPVPKPMPLPQGNYEPQQGYLQSAGNTPTGIDAYTAWNYSGGTGTGITICDIEYSWNYDHEDVTKAYGSQINTNVADPFNDNNHGTSVIGVLVSDNNGWGTTGICYNSNLLTCGSYYGSSPTWNVPGAIILAISHLSAGDIILLEQQWDYTGSNGFIPIEWWLNYSPNAQSNNGVYAAIVTAIANGIHVVQAGGNGNINTDLLLWYGNSGSIIVGAGGAYPGGTYTEGDLERLSFSSYGQRFDLQGWGENVVTTGGGDLYSAGGVNKYFTAVFSGTSSASPVVAGAVACYQGYYMANISPNPLSPLAMRQHLINYGTPQVFGPAGHIGPRPDLNLTILNLPAQQDELDFGDAPDFPYPTLLTSNGARHLISPTLFMGALIDSEPDGLPCNYALGDDQAGFDDEDGVIFKNSIVVGQTLNMEIMVNGNGYLNGWVDWNGNGFWGEPEDHIIVDLAVATGTVVVNVPVHPSAMHGFTYARFRLSSQSGLSFVGYADDGEVEDYRVLINPPMDHKMHYPQYPDPGGWDVNFTYPHRIGDDWMCSETGFVEDFHFWVSWKGDFVPEDFGVIFEIRIFSDIPADPTDPLSYSKPGALLWERNFDPGMYNYELVFEHPQGWFDPFIPEHHIWDHNNCYRIDIDDFDQPFIQEEGSIYWLVITAHVPGGGGGGTQFITLTLDGVDPTTPSYQTWTEDQAVLSIQDHPTYGTANFTINPQDIILSPGMLVVDLSAYSGTISWVEVDITESHAPGYVEAKLYDAGTLVDSKISLTGGFQTLTLTNAGLVNHPDLLTVEALEGIVHEIRFEIQLSGSDDYKIGWKTSPDHFMDVAVWESPNPDIDWEMLQDPVSGEPLSLSFIITGSPLPDELMDFGDAPAPYPTTLAQDGARHIILPGMHLGAGIDAEPDGQPDFLAAGDDLNNLQDEDGVKFQNAFVQGETVDIEIEVFGTGYINAWIDWDKNGSWADPADHVIVDYAVTTGIHTISISVPDFAVPGMTYARFRFASTTGLSYYGMANDGEVEDYRILIQEPAEHKMHYPQYPKSDGFDVEFWSELGDDFMCSTSGPIRFIRFWISHKINNITPTGSFTLKICEDIPVDPNIPDSYSMPGDTLWIRTFNPGEYIETDMEDSWQSWIELPWLTWWGHYEHYKWTQITVSDIEEPFIQTEGEIYWLVIDFGDFSPYKGWKESAEPQFNDAAVYNSIGSWAPLNRPDIMQPLDLAFIIDDMIPDDLSLQNITVTGGQTECYEAQNSITTGGSGTTFIVQNNATVYLIAGHSINMLPGTHFQSGSQVHAYIDLSGEFCTNPKAIVLEDEPVPEILPFEFADKDSFFRVYPNPNTGRFTLELREVSDHAVISVEIFSLIGETVMKLELPQMKQYLFDLSARQPGVYLIRVTKGDDVGVEKVIKH